MTAYPVWPILATFSFAALLCAITGAGNSAQTNGRNQQLDGLRGILAFSVFLHHAAFYIEYPYTGEFTEPPSHIYAHLGDSSVKLFFMITGFLFYSKILRARSLPTQTFDWKSLFVGRFLRIVPMYWFTVLSLFLVVGLLTSFKLNEPLHLLLLKSANWLNFVFTTQPDLNGVKNTSLILSGVIWTLVVEWMFYLFLPIVGRLNGIKTPTIFIVLAIIPCVWLVVFVGFRTYRTLIAITPFLGGILAAYANRSKVWNECMQTVSSAFVSAAALILNIVTMPNGHNLITPVLLTIFFVPIACGNRFLGILNSRAARFLGEISFSVYLLHGLLLYFTFKIVVPHFVIGYISSELHWSIVTALVPALLGCSALTFRLIEKKWQSAPASTINMHADRKRA